MQAGTQFRDYPGILYLISLNVNFLIKIWELYQFYIIKYYNNYWNVSYCYNNEEGIRMEVWDSGIKGLYIVEEKGKKGIVDENCDIIAPFIYSWIDPFSDGFALAYREGMGYLDSTGKEVIPCIYDGIGYDELMEDHSMNYDLDENGLMLVQRDGRWGFVDKNGKEVIPLVFEEIIDGFVEKMAAVKQDGKWGYINCQGEIIIPFSYEKANSFHEGIAAVKQNGKWGCINQFDTMVIPFQYDDITVFVNNWIEVKQGEKVGIIDYKEKKIIPCIYDYISICEKNGIYIVKKDGFYGGMNKGGEEVIPCIYNEMFFCPEDNVFWVKKEYKVLFLSPEGKEVNLSEKRRRWYRRI